jgi:two-component system nitrate/nitrite response regulator NarL
MAYTIEVALIGRNEILREGLHHILTDGQFSVTSSTSDASTVRWSSASEGEAGASRIIIVDDGFSKAAVESCIRLRRRFPDAYLVVLVDEFVFDDVVRAFRAGVDGYFVKEISCEPLIGALRLVAMGEKVLPSQFAQNLGEREFRSGRGDWLANIATLNLSDREIQIMRYLVLGCPNKVISRRLGISEATVKVYVKAILRKLRVTNRTQAAIWAVQRGLDSIDGAIDEAECACGEDAVESDPHAHEKTITDYAA